MYNKRVYVNLYCVMLCPDGLQFFLERLVFVSITKQLLCVYTVCRKVKRKMCVNTIRMVFV